MCQGPEVESAGSGENMSFAMRGPPHPTPSQLLQGLHVLSRVVHVARFENQSSDSRSIYCIAQKADTGKLFVSLKKKKKEFKPVKEAPK